MTAVPRIGCSILTAGMVLGASPWVMAAPGPERPAQGLLGLLAIITILVAVGLGSGGLALLVGQVFQRRTQLTFKVMCARPGWSLATGISVTLLGLGLLVLTKAIKPLPVLILGAFLIGLLMFGLTAAARLGTRALEPSWLDDETPPARSALRGGVLLLGINAVPILGTLVFAGVIFAGIGATLLGYFAGLSGPSKPAAATPAPSPTPTTPATPTVATAPPAGSAPAEPPPEPADRGRDTESGPREA